MLAAVGDDGRDISTHEDSSGDQSVIEQEMVNPEANSSTQQVQLPPSSGEDPPVDEVAKPDEVETDANRTYIENLHQLVAPVKKSLNQLSRQNCSIWLLAYIDT